MVVISKPAQKTHKWGDNLPPAFVEILESLQDANKSSSIRLIECDPPKKLSKCSVGIEGYLDPDIATGRFVVLYDPLKNELWGGDTRVMTYTEADLNADMYKKCDYADQIWAHYLKELERIGAASATSTITVTSDHYYGDIEALDLGLPSVGACRESSQGIEIRASWTASSRSLLKDLQVWEKMMLQIAGVKRDIKIALAELV
jgi:hypothetical protein